MFARLNEAHRDLDKLLLLHQECLIIGAFDEARALLESYRGLLLLHMQHEEVLVLPIYARAADKRWPVELYTGQHAKLLSLLERAAGALATLAKTAGWRRAVIALLEIETTLKHLLEHHHLAEDEALYPTADRQCSATERAAVVDRCIGEWRSTTAAHDDVIARGQRCIAAA